MSPCVQPSNTIENFSGINFEMVSSTVCVGVSMYFIKLFYASESYIKELEIFGDSLTQNGWGDVKQTVAFQILGGHSTGTRMFVDRCPETLGLGWLGHQRFSEGGTKLSGVHVTDMRDKTDVASPSYFSTLTTSTNAGAATRVIFCEKEIANALSANRLNALLLWDIMLELQLVASTVKRKVVPDMHHP